MLKKSLLFAGACYFLFPKAPQCSPEPPLTMILRGEYENKIRRFSPPQKIFDVFATIYHKGHLLMSLQDLLKAICFYNYSKSDQSHIENFRPHHILKFLGKDDQFQIYDYFILARFLAMDKQSIGNFLFTNKLAEMTKQDFQQFLLKQICSDYIAYIKAAPLIESRQFRPSYQQFQKKIKQIASSLFHDQQSITSRQLQKYRKRMVEQLYQFQFKMFPIEQETIDGTDFARSIIKYVQPSKTKKYMKRIKKMTEFQKIKVDIKAYKAFHMYMSTNMSQIQKILNQKGAMSTYQLAQLINQYVNRKGSVSMQQISVIVKILDHDDSGFLQKKEVLGVLKNLQYYTTVKSGELTLFESMKMDFNKFMDKLKKIQEILQE